MTKYKINSKCIACGSCAGVCPMGAIAMGEQHFEIDKSKCAGCGMCATMCPMDAIHIDTEPEKDSKQSGKEK